MTERMENALRHIKTSVDVDPWAVEEVERVFKAYEQQPKPMYYPQVEGITPTVIEPQDGDLIDRAEALKCLEFTGDYVTLNEVHERLSKLPSIPQPQGGDEMWWGNNFNTITIKSTSQPQEPVGNTDTLNNDLISRQAVMERIENEYRQWGEEYDVQQVLGDIEDLPSATPVRPTGHWIEHEKVYECSECHIVRAKGTTGKYNYCPSCGSRMREDGDADE